MIAARFGRRLVCLLLLLGAAAAQAAEAAEPSDRGAVAALVLDMVGAADRPSLAALRGYYQNESSPPIWIASDRGPALVRQLVTAQAEGLNPRDYPISELVSLLPVLAAPKDPAAAAHAEMRFGDVFLQYASDLKVGRLSPRRLDPELFAQKKTIDGVAVLTALSRAADAARFFASLAPQNPEYRALRRLLSEHRRLARSGGWPTVPAGDTLRPGDRDARIAWLRARLEWSSDITVGVDERQFFDPALAMAVERFQTRHGLAADRVVGPMTLAALNVPLDERIKQIVLNMERWRWLPEDLGDRYILVNIAGFELTLVDGGAVDERMPVIVGQPYRRTPVFSDAIRYLEFNPTWTVPYSIATKDKLPQLQEDPSELEALGFEVFQDGVQIPIRSANWAEISPRTFRYTLRQKPGPRNALGRVKFMFPNQFSVYLHDTPAKGLFARSARAFSSGCIRLGRPIDLAAKVLSADADWTRARIDAILASEKTQVINLAVPLPVHLTYSTAWSGDGGTVHFRPDIYERDKSLYAALFAKEESKEE